jgi:signal transduction histidine kinase
MLDDGPLKDKLINDLRRLIHLVNQLLRLMRIGGAKSLDKEIDLVQCCQRVVRERSMLAENAQVTLQFQPEVESYVIPGDEGLLEVAIANLVDNAVSFSEPHSCVDILLHRDGVLSVRDYGPGIPSDKVQSLFEPFAKFPPNRNGHGLGLAIVKAIASLHSAQVDAENMENGGAQFNIRFHSQFKQNPSQ